MSRVLITGANGFIGQTLCSVLEDAGFEIIPVVRTLQPDQGKSTHDAAVGKSIDAKTDWTDELAEVVVVIHLAAKVHVLHGCESDGLAGFREINVEGTRNLARQAAQYGVKRFIYLSSIKVNGERTSKKPFSADQTPKPKDAYAISKREAEIALREIEEDTGMEVVIIRPPLVYGPGLKGNLAALIGTIERGVPLPLAAVNNRRDLVSIYNLCDLIRICCLHPAAAGSTFLVSDGKPISTPNLIRHLAKALDRKARLVFVPTWALKLAASLFGKAGAVQKLTGDLQIDMSATQDILEWEPPLTVTESFQKMSAEG